MGSIAVSENGTKANGASNGEIYNIPTEMKAIRYNKVKDWSLVTMPVPTPKAHEILVKGL
jgi:D-arabinitol dehydrogenase (NADP+)